MAIQIMVIDPNAGTMSGDEIIAAINEDSTTTISKASVVDAAARPIVDGEVTSAKLDDGVAKDNLDAMADVERGYVKTNPGSGEYPVIAVQRDSSGYFEVEYDDVPIE